MPASQTIYGFIQEGTPYVSCSIRLLTNAIPSGAQLDFGALTEPSVLGYSPIGANDLLDLFPSARVVPGQMVRLTSRPLRFVNNAPFGTTITGVALVVDVAPSDRMVMVIVPKPAFWAGETSISGQLVITSTIHTEGS